jgi:tRNA A37 threonylcarbamoyladenosine dehydratase
MVQKIDRVYLIGCGGIGSILIEPLAKLLTYHVNGTSDITLIDGDNFEGRFCPR